MTSKPVCRTAPSTAEPWGLGLDARGFGGLPGGTSLAAANAAVSPCRYFHPGGEPLELDSRFWALRDSIVQCELLMLRVLRFQVSFQHPHKVPAGGEWQPFLGTRAFSFLIPRLPPPNAPEPVGHERKSRVAARHWGSCLSAVTGLRGPSCPRSPGFLRQLSFQLLPFGPLG